MRVLIREKDGSALRIPIPVGLLLNQLTAPLALFFATPYLKKYGVALTCPQLCRLLRALRKAKRCLKGAPFVEVREAKGGAVTVWL